MKINDHSRFWYALYTKSRYEKKVSSELNKKSIENYLPLQRQLKQWSDRKKWVEEPLIGSYIFVRIQDKEYFNVLNTSGVVKFISFSGKPARVREDQIDLIRKISSSDVELSISEEDLSCGELVDIAYGPLKGISGELITYKGNKRVVIKIEEIGQSLLLTVPLQYIEKRRLSMIS